MIASRSNPRVVALRKLASRKHRREAGLLLAEGTSIIETALAENYAAALEEVLRLKPASSKGRYIKKVVISTTMGPGIEVDPNRTRNVAVDDTDN